MNGIEKEVDRLGRVVIPAEYRKRLGIKEGMRVLLSFENDAIMMRAENGCCAICGKKVNPIAKIRLCAECLAQAKAEG